MPFSFIPCAGSAADGRTKTPKSKPGRIRALPERLVQHPYLEITFPRVVGYRYEMPPAHLEARFTDESRVVLSTADIPMRVENAPIVGETVFLTLDDLKKRREQEVAFALAKLVLEKYFRAEDGEPAPEPDDAHQPVNGVQVLAFPPGACHRQALDG